MNTSLTAVDLRMIAALLKLASSEFSNHGCNDLKWPAWLPEADRYPLALAVATDMGDPKEAPEEAESQAKGKYGPMDWMLMSYYSRLLEKLAGTSSWKRVAEELPPEEKKVLLSWGSPERSAVGFRRTRDGETWYVVNRDAVDGEDPVLWMDVPTHPQQ